MEYRQFDFNFERLTFIIEEKGVNIKKKTISSSTETFRRFEDMGTRIVKEKSRKIGWLIAAAVFMIITATVFVRRMQGDKIGDNAEIFWLVIALILFAVYMLTKTNHLYLTHSDFSGSIQFINRSAYKESLDSFIKLVLEKRKEYLLKEYFVLDEFVPPSTQEDNLVWLYNQELISKEQLTEKLEDLKKLEPFKLNKNENAIGFRRSNADLEDSI